MVGKIGVATSDTTRGLVVLAAAFAGFGSFVSDDVSSKYRRSNCSSHTVGVATSTHHLDLARAKEGDGPHSSPGLHAESTVAGVRGASRPSQGRHALACALRRGDHLRQHPKVHSEPSVCNGRVLPSGGGELDAFGEVDRNRKLVRNRFRCDEGDMCCRFQSRGGRSVCHTKHLKSSRGENLEGMLSSVVGGHVRLHKVDRLLFASRSHHLLDAHSLPKSLHHTVQISSLKSYVILSLERRAGESEGLGDGLAYRILLRLRLN
mmetsp:Transcript_25077/g.59222  ORF Transcript_25077/g.59222 Transcript_25077/m.59222 type:complete len:263 (-) Transcript_25077:150-938(-)